MAREGSMLEGYNPREFDDEGHNLTSSKVGDTQETRNIFTQDNLSNTPINAIQAKSILEQGFTGAFRVRAWENADRVCDRRFPPQSRALELIIRNELSEVTPISVVNAIRSLDLSQLAVQLESFTDQHVIDIAINGRAVIDLEKEAGLRNEQGDVVVIEQEA